MATDLEHNAVVGAQKAQGEANPEDVFRPIGRYMLLKRIARGGMGEVYLASTMGLEGAERPVVVKIIRREHSKDPSFIARFLDEARVQAQLQHSGVAQVLDAAIDERTGAAGHQAARHLRHAAAPGRGRGSDGHPLRRQERLRAGCA